MKELLTELGINAGLITSGLFGSLLTIKRDSTKRLGAVLLSITTGVGSANYLTPIVVDFVNINNRNLEFGIAFILGYLGLSGIEFAVKRALPQFNLPSQIPSSPEPKRKPPAKRKAPAGKRPPAAKKTTTRRKKPQE